MKNKWFEEVFLTSFLEKRSAGTGIWLTAKQTSVCVRYMNCHTNRIAHAYGEIWNHTYYTYVWDDREVTLNYSKKNGCGILCIGLTAEEKAENSRRNAEERQEKEKKRRAEMPERAERIAKRLLENNKNEYDKRISEMKKKLIKLQDDLEDEFLEDEKEQCQEWIEETFKKIEDLKTKIEIWEKAKS